jgi:hypothetical protein
VSKNLIITFFDDSGRELFMNKKESIFKNELKIINLSKKKNWK